MAATPSVVIRKTFSYRGNTQPWSNRYHFLGGTPADLTHWNTLFDAIVLAEKATFGSWHTIVQAVGYAAGSNVAVASKAYTTAGTGSFGGARAPGDVTALIRYSTAARTSKGHPIYLFNYYHGVEVSTVTPFDNLQPAQLTAMNVYGSSWLAGFSDGTNSYTRAGPNGAAATARTTEQYVTHRDFPR